MNVASRLTAALWEAGRHSRALGGALRDWSAASVPDWQTVESDPALVRLMDQILYRFTKLQDAIGERLVPATLAVLAESFEDWPMRDRLNRLEKLGYLDVQSWLGWRDVRNRLAHEYPSAAEARFALLESAVAASHELLAAHRRWYGELHRAGLVPANESSSAA